MSSSRRPSLLWFGLAAVLVAATLLATRHYLQTGTVEPHALSASAPGPAVVEADASNDEPLAIRVAATPDAETVVVVDENGQPVVGARLFAHEHVARHVGLPPRSPESDTNGALLIAGVDPEAADHTCYHAGYQPAGWDGESRIVLRPGVEVHGQVRGLDGAPIGGALVQVSRADWESPRNAAAVPPLVPTAVASAVFEARTDQRGGFVIRGLPVGRYHLRTSHSTRITTDVDGQGRVAMIDAPCGGVAVTMAPIVGCRVEFGGETLLSSSMLYPRGLRTGLAEVDRRLGRPSRAMAPQAKFFEYCGVPTPDGAEPMLVLYALLSESGPVRFDLPLRPIDHPDYTLVREPVPGPIRTGRVHVEVVDSRGREVDTTVTLVGDKGVQLFEVSNRDAAMNLDAGDLKWGARLPANAPALVRAGRYQMISRDAILGRGMTPRPLVALADDLVRTRVELPWPVARVRVDVAAPASTWKLQVFGNLVASGRCSKTLPFTTTHRAVLLLPPGNYQLNAVSPGRRPMEHEFTVEGEDLTIDLGAFEHR